MNPHVELVRKWLADPESVSLKELEANLESATSYATYDVAVCAYATYDVAVCAYEACANDSDYWTAEAKKHVQEYEDRMGVGE